MDAADDRQLLAAYAATRDAEAFAVLVRRYADLVYTSARRRTRDAHLADDVTQAVFLLLARRAGSIGTDVVLAGWLYRAAGYAANNAVKAAARRQRHERKVAAMRSEATEPTAGGDGNRLSELLDAAVAALPPKDRDLVLFRAARGVSFADAATALGITENAAKKRMARAVDRLRAWAEARGMPVAAGGAEEALRAALARPAPPHVVAAACRTAGDATAPGTVAATVDATGTAMRLVAVAKAAAAVIGVLTMVALAVGVILAATTRPTALPKPPPPPAALRDDAGAVVSAGDVIVDVRLPPGVKPKVFATVACPETGAVATILQRLDAETVRCATSVDGEWPVGAEVVYMGECSSTTVPPERLAAVVAALAAEAKPVDAKAFVETGIKAVDLLSPVTRGGTLAVHGPWPGAGKTVVVSELLHRLGDRPDATTIIAFTSPISAATMFNELDDGVEYPAPVYRGERGGRARLAWVLTDASAADTAPGGPAPDGAAAALVLSLVTAAQDLWPAVDVAASRSVALDAAVVGAEHCDVARRVRECVAHANELLYATAADDPRPAKRQDLIPWLAKRYTDRLPRLSPDDRLLVARARKLQRFFTQPLHVAEPMNRRPGVSVPVAETIRGCREILDGKLDDVAEERFIFKGTIDDVRAVQR